MPPHKLHKLSQLRPAPLLDDRTCYSNTLSNSQMRNSLITFIALFLRSRLLALEHPNPPSMCTLSALSMQPWRKYLQNLKLRSADFREIEKIVREYKKTRYNPVFDPGQDIGAKLALQEAFGKYGQTRVIRGGAFPFPPWPAGRILRMSFVFYFSLRQIGSAHMLRDRFVQSQRFPNLRCFEIE